MRLNDERADDESAMMNAPVMNPPVMKCPGTSIYTMLDYSRITTGYVLDIPRIAARSVYHASRLLLVNIFVQFNILPIKDAGSKLLVI